MELIKNDKYLGIRLFTSSFLIIVAFQLFLSSTENNIQKNFEAESKNQIYGKEMLIDNSVLSDDLQLIDGRIYLDNSVDTTNETIYNYESYARELNNDGTINYIIDNKIFFNDRDYNLYETVINDKTSFVYIKFNGKKLIHKAETTLDNSFEEGDVTNTSIKAKNDKEFITKIKFKNLTYISQNISEYNALSPENIFVFLFFTIFFIIYSVEITFLHYVLFSSKYFNKKERNGRKVLLQNKIKNTSNYYKNTFFIYGTTFEIYLSSLLHFIFKNKKQKNIEKIKNSELLKNLEYNKKNKEKKNIQEIETHKETSIIIE